jgi:hypothetical protein
MSEQSLKEVNREEQKAALSLLQQQQEEDVLFSFRLLPYNRSFLERFATRFLYRRSHTISPQETEDPVHILTPNERKNLNRIVKVTVLRAMFAGFCSATIPALIDIKFQDDPDRLLYLICFTIMATLLEVSFLYWSHLNAMVAMTQATGATLGSDQGSLADAMARAALELPDPTSIVEGINPRRDSSRTGLILAVALYKIKRGLTSFVFKFAIRQTATREALRILAPFIALPISGAWNAIVSYRILREARMRVLGPSAAEVIVADLLDHIPQLSESGKSMLLRAVGVAMVRKRSAHPNLLVLLYTVVKRTGSVRAREIDSTKYFLKFLPNLEPEEKKLALIILQVGFVLDGSLSRAEKSFIIKARKLCGLSKNLLAVEELLQTFISGDQIYPGMLEALSRD